MYCKISEFSARFLPQLKTLLFLLVLCIIVVNLLNSHFIKKKQRNDKRMKWGGRDKEHNKRTEKEINARNH